MNSSFKSNHTNLFGYINRYGFLIGILLWIFNLIKRISAFTLQAVLRWKIGRNSLNFFVLVLGFIWVNFFAAIKFESAFSIQEIMSWSDFIMVLVFQQPPINKFLHYYSILYLIMSLGNFLYYHGVPEFKKPHLSYRGKSHIFSWTTRYEQKIDIGIFSRYIEPAMCVVLGGILIFTNTVIAFGYYLLLSGIALLMEEQKTYKEEELYMDPSRRARQ